MDPGTITAWLELLTKLGIGFTAACVFFIWMLYKGTVVWGTYCEAIKLEKDEWKTAALSGTGILEKLVDKIEAKQL